MLGSGRSMMVAGLRRSRKDFGEDVADVVLRCALGEELEDDEVVVAVGDDAGEVVGLGEDEAAGVVLRWTRVRARRGVASAASYSVAQLLRDMLRASVRRRW